MDNCFCALPARPTLHLMIVTPKNFYMKKFLLMLLVLASSFAYANNTIDEKILKTFKEAFPKAEKVTWYEEGGSYQVLFTCDAVKCRMYFDNKGDATKTIRYYTEQNLCPLVMTKIKQKFAGKNIFGITEVSTDSGTTYNIILEDEKKWYHVLVDTDGSVQLEKKYTKA